MKKTLVMRALPLVIAFATPQAVLAGFHMEGLQPFSEAYCNGQKEGLDEGFITPPAGAWETTSPDSTTLGGRAAWDAKDCLAGKWSGKAGRVHRQPSAAPVPQK